jgi:hypothetical protein
MGSKESFQDEPEYKTYGFCLMKTRQTFNKSSQHHLIWGLKLIFLPGEANDLQA